LPTIVNAEGNLEWQFVECKHYTKPWEESTGLTSIQKGILGESLVMTALKLLKMKKNLLSGNPVRIGDPYKLIADNHQNPDIYAPGNNHDYLIEVKNIWYMTGSVPGAPYPAFYRQSRSWVHQNIIKKNWNAESYPIRKQAGEHHGSKDTIRIKNWKPAQNTEKKMSAIRSEKTVKTQADPETTPLSTVQHNYKNIQNASDGVNEVPDSSGVVRVLVGTYPSFTERAEVDLLEFFGGGNMIFTEHPFTPLPSTGSFEECEVANHMLLVLRLEELLKFNEDRL
jgi:hypothetical protein